MHHIHRKKLEKFMIGFGLDHDERAIFFSVFEQGKMTVLELARQTGIGRVTVHNKVARMREQGLLREELLGKKRFIALATIDQLEDNVEQKVDQAKSIEATFLDVKTILEGSMQNTESFPTVQMYTAAQGMSMMLEQVAQHSHPMYVISDNKKFTDYLSPYKVLQSYRKRKRAGVETFLLVTENFDDIRAPNYEDYLIAIKTIPTELLINGAINIQGENIYFHTFYGDVACTAHMKSAIIASMLLALRKGLWTQASSYYPR